jgi:hypothetical protein
MNRALFLAALLTFAPRASAVQPEAFRLPSGLRCLLVETHDQPFVRFELVTRWDPREEPADQPGLSFVLASLMRAGGAGNDSRQAFDQAIDDLGVGFAFASRRGAFTWTMAADSRNQEPIMDRLADAVFRPRIDGTLLEAQRQAWLRTLQTQDPRDRGIAEFLWALGDPLAEAPPEERVYQGLGLDSVQAFRRRVLRPEASVLAIHGDLSLVQAKELVYLHFGLWGAAPAPPVPRAAVPPSVPFKAVLEFRDPPELWAGSPVPADVPPALLEILGVLLEALPSEAAPGIQRTCRVGPDQPFLLKLKAGTDTRDGLPTVLLASLASLRTQGFTAADLDRARIRWKARRAALPLHPADLLHRLQAGALDPAFDRGVDALDVGTVNAALARILDPAALRYLLLGADASQVQAAEKAGLGPATLFKPRS